MRIQDSKFTVRTLVLSALAACAFTGVAFAGPNGGGGHSSGSGGHSSSGHASGHAGAVHGGPGFHRGGTWSGNWHGPWPGHRPGFRVGLFFPFLPWGFETFWWGGVPYYYADSSYYLWDQDAGEYVTVEPPDTSQEGADNSGTYAQAGPNGANEISGGNGPLGTPDLFAYPKKDQPEPQQARDREECRDWAKRQTSYDPSEPHLNSAQEAQNRGSYLRAEAACLEARDYSVK